MKKYTLGVDIGIASVGWGMINEETGEIIDHGVRLFGEGTADDNLERRKFRSSRRLKRRRKHRLDRLKNLLIKEGYMGKGFSSIENPYEIRVRALREKVSKEELATAVLHIAKRRGFGDFSIVAEGKDAEKDESETKKIFSQNARELEGGKEVCEIQLERMQRFMAGKGERMRGEENRFQTKYYLREAKRILEKQDIPLDMQEKILHLIQTRRSYADGPGNAYSPTPYGPFVYDENGYPERNEDGTFKTISMIEKMRGKCSVFPEKNRAPKTSFTACLFNLLNDVNNLRSKEEKISPEEKREIVEACLRGKNKPSLRLVCKVTGWKKEEVFGWSKSDKKGEPVFSDFTGWREIRKRITPEEATVFLDKSDTDRQNSIDILTEILTGEKNIDKRKEKMTASFSGILAEKSIDNLARSGAFVGYHALSFEAMRAILEDLMETSKNQAQLFWERRLRETSASQEELQKTKKGDIPFYDEAILSPVAKRAHRQAIAVINAVRKKYGEPATIVVEMARDKNGDERKKFLTALQKKNEARREKIREEWGEIRLSPKQSDALILLEQQEGKCMYTGKPIDRNAIVSDERLFEIDHIIPKSVSFDDSMDNKALCVRIANQKKKNQTPFGWFSSGHAPESWEVFRKRILAMKQLSRKKREYLLCEDDVAKYSVQKKFINRNLVDTRYASRTFLNAIQSYFRQQNLDVAVHTVRGGVTAAFRKKAGINKDRDADYSHHAADALIVAGIKKLRLFEKAWHIGVQENDDAELRFDGKTGEVITEENEDAFFDPKFIDFVKRVRETAKTTKYSHKIDRKPNRSMADQTLYGVCIKGKKEYIIGRYKNIYEKNGDGAKLALHIRKNREGIFMREADPETYAVMEKIVKEYPKETNPFLTYYTEHKEYLHKRSKGGRGPAVMSVRYRMSMKPNEDISNKYQNGSGGKVVLCSIKPYRMDVYREKNGKILFMKIPFFWITRKKGISTSYFWEIDPIRYLKEKEKRKISETATFLFSLNKNEVFEFVRLGKKEVGKFVGIKNSKFQIEYTPVEKPSEKEKDKEGKEKSKRYFLDITGSVTEMKKYSVDVLGNRYCVKSPKNPVLRWKL